VSCNAGHLPHIEQPAPFFAELERFVGGEHDAIRTIAGKG